MQAYIFIFQHTVKVHRAVRICRDLISHSTSSNELLNNSSSPLERGIKQVEDVADGRRHCGLREAETALRNRVAALAADKPADEWDGTQTRNVSHNE
jgi:hypothetical protein